MHLAEAHSEHSNHFCNDGKIQYDARSLITKSNCMTDKVS